MQKSSQDIVFWSPRKRANRKKAWEVRWRVDNRPFSRSRTSRELADALLRDLRKAAKEGERFSLSNGEPESWASAGETVWSVLVASARKAWGTTGAGNTRRTIEDATVLIALAAADPRKARTAPAPLPQVRSALRLALKFRINPKATRPEDRVLDPLPLPQDAQALVDWVEAVSLPIGTIDTTTAADVVARLSMRAGGGAPLAPETVRRRRSVLSAALDHAVTERLLPVNPLAGAEITRGRTADAVDPRTVPDYEQAGRLVRAVRSDARDAHLAAFFATAYLAGTRPSETRGIRAGDITWPEHVKDPKAVPGWGVLMAGGSRTETAAAYTDDGRPGEDRSLKHRSDDTVRPVPLPPELVSVLRHHIDTFGTAPDGRLWWHETPSSGPFGTLTGKRYRGAWARARKAALTDAERAQGLAQRPYDLRHGCATYGLYRGVPAPEMARRLGHTVAELHKTYTHWLTGETNTANELLNSAYTEDGPLMGHGPQNDDEQSH